MAFSNRIRLPFHLSKPQFPDTRNVFKRADGTIKVLSVSISKVYTGETEHMPEWVHQSLKIALAHDHVNIEQNDMMIGVVSEGDYDIDWNDFMYDPLAPAKFKVAVTPFNFSNANCLSCDDVNQLSLTDDTIEEELLESTQYTKNVFTNDTVSCSPFTVELTYINETFVDSATIDETGLLTINTKATFAPTNNVKLVTYRVTCSNGSYDEADVIANANGTETPTCLAPSGVNLDGIQDDSATLAWLAPTPDPAEGYEWQLAPAANPADIIDSGTTVDTSVSVPSLTGDPLDPSTEYIFSVRSACGGGDFSAWVNFNFTTESSVSSCGKYRITFFDETDHKDVTYINCGGSSNTIRLFPYKPRIICALEDSPLHPVSIIGADDIQYRRFC